MAEAFFWGLVAASSLVLGAWIVSVHAPGSRALGLIMGFGVGVLLSAVAYELVEEAIAVSSGEGGTGLGFFSGALVFFAGDTALARRQAEAERRSGTKSGGAALPLVLGIVLDGVPESAVVGLTLLTTGEVGLSMLVAVFVSNVPESIAATTDLLEGGWRRNRVYLLWAVVAVSCAGASALGYQLLDGASSTAVAFVLAFAGGAILCMLTTTMVPEAYERAGRLAGLATTVGFAVALSINLMEG